MVGHYTMRRRLLLFVAITVWFSGLAFTQEPPKEEGRFRTPDLVEIIRLDPSIKLDIRYATSNNFLGRPVYEEARAFLQRPAAEAVVRAHQQLKERGYGLVIFDGYRPWYVTRIFWDATPEDKKLFVADPSQGSRHNRGCAVDLSLFDLKTGVTVTMPGGYDEMSERSHIDYQGGTEESRRLRDLLRSAMESEGFAVYEPEWWHYDYKDWKEYPILNLRFDRIARLARLGCSGGSRVGDDQGGFFHVFELIDQDEYLIPFLAEDPRGHLLDLEAPAIAVED